MIEILFALTVLSVMVLGLRRVRREGVRHHQELIIATLLSTLGPAVVRADPRELLAWYHFARTIRKVFPDAITVIETTTGEEFPIPRELLEEAHSRWTSEWLFWERQHHADFTARERALQAELAEDGEVSSVTGRDRLATLENEKLQMYQQHYEEYVRIGSKFGALLDSKQKGSH